MRRTRSILATPRRAGPALAAALAAAALCACGDGGSDSSSDGDGGTATASEVGRFVDAAVSNLSYRCSGLSGTGDTAGVTDDQGQFDYASGQTCSFSIGGIALGSAAGAAVLTPVSLVPGATAEAPGTQAVNIVRLLMSLDSDADPGNGIAIDAATGTALLGQALDFAAADFDTAAAAIVRQAFPGRALVDAATAAAHLDLSLVGRYAGGYSCTYSGVVNGTNTVLGSVAIQIVDGVIDGTGTPRDGGSSFAVHGTVSAGGSANLSAGSTSTGAVFSGQFSSGGSAGTAGTGTWTDPDLGSGSWKCAPR